MRIHALFAMLAASGCVVGEDAVELDEPTTVENDGATDEETTGDTDTDTTVLFAIAGAFADSEASDHAARFDPHRRNHRDRAALDRRACLNEIARRRARRMAAGECPGDAQICHFGGLGSAINNSCPWQWTAAGENVGVGGSELSLWKAFLGSAPHHDNIDSATFTRFGVGAFRRASDNQLFIVHIFARP